MRSTSHTHADWTPLSMGCRVKMRGGGPVLAALQAWPPVLGLVFGAFGEASTDVDRLALAAASLRAASDWRRLGARDEEEARAFLIAQVRRRWGCAAVRERARMLLARLPQIGRPQPRVPGRAGLGDSQFSSPAVFQDGALGLSLS